MALMFETVLFHNCWGVKGAHLQNHLKLLNRIIDTNFYVQKVPEPEQQEKLIIY